jgi:6-phosphogluconolactonase (cycloisomerase 2 family)
VKTLTSSQPDKKFLLISSRQENAFNIPPFDSSSQATIPSDTLVVFSIDPATAGLTFVQKTAAGGRGPRHFTTNKAGNLVAVGLQADSRVVVIERDVATGKLGKFLAAATVEGDVTTVIFDE